MANPAQQIAQNCIFQFNNQCTFFVDGNNNASISYNNSNGIHTLAFTSNGILMTSTNGSVTNTLLISPTGTNNGYFTLPMTLGELGQIIYSDGQGGSYWGDSGSEPPEPPPVPSVFYSLLVKNMKNQVLTNSIPVTTIILDNIEYQYNGEAFASNTFTCVTAGVYAINGQVLGNIAAGLYGQFRVRVLLNGSVLQTAVTACYYENSLLFYYVVTSLNEGDTISLDVLLSSSVTQIYQLLSGNAIMYVDQIDTSTKYVLSASANSVSQTFANSLTQVLFPTIIYQENGSQFTANTFTCSIAGNYKVVTYLTGNITNEIQQSVIVSINQNGVAVKSTVSYTNILNGVNNWFSPVLLQSNLDVAVSDTITIYVKGSNTGNLESNFGVFLYIQQL